MNKKLGALGPGNEAVEDSTGAITFTNSGDRTGRATPKKKKESKFDLIV